MAELILITGGCRSGKSAFAVNVARQCAQPTLFLATCLPGPDVEMQARVAAHRAERPAHWSLREEGHDLVTALGRVAEPVVILDCIPTWIGNLLIRGDSDASITSASFELIESISTCTAHWLLAVTAEVGAGLVPETELGRRFRDGVGVANQRLAAAASRVYGMAAGLAVEWKAQARRPEAVAADLERMFL